MEREKCGKECGKPSLIKDHAIAVYSLFNRREIFLPETALEFSRLYVKTYFTHEKKNYLNLKFYHHL